MEVLNKENGVCCDLFGSNTVNLFGRTRQTTKNPIRVTCHLAIIEYVLTPECKSIAIELNQKFTPFLQPGYSYIAYIINKK